MGRWRIQSQEIRVRGAVVLKFEIGDNVRLSKVKRTFEKGYTARWTMECFKVIAVDESTTPVMYEVEDMMGEKVDGKFYTQELQKTSIPNFRIIDKVVSRKTEHGKKYVLVSYLEHPAKFNEWILESDYKKFLKLKGALV